MKYLDDLRNINQLIERISARTAIDMLSADGAGDVMEQLGCALRGLQGAQVAVAARYTGLGVFRADGHRDAAGWLRAKQGVSGRDAKRVGDAARAVSASPAVAEALASGVAGVDQVAALATLAERAQSGDVDGPIVEQLLSRANVSPELFGHDVRRAEIYATGLDENARALARRARSKVRIATGDGGMEVLIADLDPERHAVVLNAIDAIVNETWRNQHALRLGEAAANAERRSGTAVEGAPVRELARLRADALVEMAERSLAGAEASVAVPAKAATPASATATLPSTSATSTSRSSTCGSATSSAAARAPSPSRRSRRGEAKVIVHIDYETLAGGIRTANSTSELDGGTPIPPESVRRLGCEAGIIPVVLGGKNQPLDIGREGRLATYYQTIAARARSSTCEFAGCTVPHKWCYLHHITWWSTGGGTDLHNMVLLCSAHHHLVHEGGWTITRNKDGTVSVAAPTRRSLVLTS